MKFILFGAICVFSSLAAVDAQKATTETQDVMTETQELVTEVQEPVTEAQKSVTEGQEFVPENQKPFEYDTDCTRGSNKGKKCMLIQNCPDLHKKAKKLRLDEPVALVTLFGYANDEMKMTQEVEQATCRILKTREEEHVYYFIRYACCNRHGLKNQVVFHD